MRLVIRTAVVALIAAVVALPTAAYADRSNTLAGATSTSPLRTIIKETVQSGSDVDWFRFTTGSGSYSRILLTNVPQDYAIQLYRPSGALVATSQRPGRAFEEIYRYLAAGTYYVKVYSPSHQYSGTPYSLAFRPMTDGVVVLSSRWFRPFAGYAEVHGEVLNNTGTIKPHLLATVRFHDSTGKVVHSVTDLTASNYTDPRKRTVFMAYSYDVPASAVRYSVSVSWPTGYSTLPNLAGLALHGTTSPGPGYVNLEGTVTNKTGGTARAVEVTQTRYTAAGTVYSVASMPVNINDTLANGASGPFHGQAENSSAVTFARWAVFGHR